MASGRKPEPNLTEAAARTTGVLRTLQSRLNREPLAPAEESPEELGNQLQQYFAASTEASPVPNDIREQVIAGVVDRILRSWEEPNAGLSALKSEIVERLVNQVLAELSRNA